MFQFAYDPFDNQLDSVSGEDLHNLRDIPESWHIDYKRSSLKTLDYAKQLSSFANQYGGWLFIGIEEDEKNRTASKFCGIPNSELANACMSISQAAALVSPFVDYKEKIVHGPVSTIGLEKDHAIIIIGIPKSHRTPHIHPSGQIYRRVSDHSSPKPETDRHILDELWTRRDEHNSRKNARLNELPELIHDNLDRPWAHIFIKPVDNKPSPKALLDFDDFERIMTVKKPHSQRTVHVPFNSVYSSLNGYVARQLQNDPVSPTLTVRYWHDGLMRFDIPLNLHEYPFLDEITENASLGREFFNTLNNAGFKSAKIIDYSKFIGLTAGLCEAYLLIYRLLEDRRDLRASFTLRNVMGTSPFVNSQKYLDRIRLHSLPISIDKEIKHPKQYSDSHGIELTLDAKKEVPSMPDELAPFFFCMPIYYILLNSVGVFPDNRSFVDDFATLIQN